MLPGNERQDVEKGGKSEYFWLNNEVFKFLCCDFLGEQPMKQSILFVLRSYYATVSSGPTHTIERRLSDVIQIDKQ